MAHQIMRPAAKVSGPGTLFTKQGIYEESETQKHPLGERLEVGDRVFYYAKAGAAITAGNVCEMPAYAGATTTLQNTSDVTVAAPAGATRIYVNAVTTAQAADLFAEGYAAVFDATTTGKCWLFRIKGNSALATSGTTSYIDVYDAIPEALTTSDQVCLMTNMYLNIVQSPATTQAGACVGVAPISITSGYYFWLQTYGPCQVYASESALVLNETFTRTDAAVAGAVEKLSAVDSGSAEQPVLGYTLHVGTQDECSMAFLTIRS
jgi:hypothetical protein